MTERNYRAGSWFFYGIAILFGLVTPCVIVADFRRFGLHAALADAGLLGLLLGLAVAFGWVIRHLGAKST